MSSSGHPFGWPPVDPGDAPAPPPERQWWISGEKRDGQPPRFRPAADAPARRRDPASRPDVSGRAGGRAGPCPGGTMGNPTESKGIPHRGRRRGRQRSPSRRRSGFAREPLLRADATQGAGVRERPKRSRVRDPATCSALRRGTREERRQPTRPVRGTATGRDSEHSDAEAARGCAGGTRGPASDTGRAD